MLITHTSLPQALISRSLMTLPSASPASLSPEPSLPSETFVAGFQEPAAEKAAPLAAAPAEVAEVSPSPLPTPLPTGAAARLEAAPMTLSLLEAPSFSVATQEPVGSTVADLAYAGMSQDSENPLFAFGNAWLSKIPRAEGETRGAVQAALMEKLSGASDFAIEDVKGVLASAQSKLDRFEDLRVLNDSLFKTLAASESGGNALETAKQWKKSVPGGEPGVRNAITDSLLETFLNDPHGDLELANFRPAYDGVMARLDESEQRTATDAFFRVLSRESDSSLVEFGREWASRCGEGDEEVRAAITDGLVDQILTGGGEMEPAEFAQLYGKIQGQLSRDEDLQVLNNTLFASIGKESDSSLIELGKAWVKEVPAGEKSARAQIVNGFLQAFIANPTEELDTPTILSTYRSVMEADDRVETQRELNDAFMRVLKKDADGHPLFELSSAWSRVIPAGEKSARNAITDGVLEFFLKDPERGDLDTDSLPEIYQSVLAQVGHDDDLRLLNDALLRTMSRDTDSKLLEVGQGWLKAIDVDNRAPRAAVTDTILGRFMAEPGHDLEAAGLPALAAAAMEQAGHRYVADDVISGLLEYLAKGNDRKDLAALAKQPYSAEGLQRKLDAVADLVSEGQG